MSTVGKKKVSQQLVEFLFVVPFMVIILGILTEYAYALNINLTIAQGIKMATSAGYTAKDDKSVDHNYGTYSQIAPQNSATESKDFIVAKVTNGFIQYLQDNNVPTTTENNITVTPIKIGQTQVFVAGYTYIPAFTLPNVYFKFMPDKFNFSAAAAVPAAFLEDNSAYVGGYQTDDLNQIWARGGDLADKTSFDSSRQGIIKSDTGGGRSSFTFLIPNSELSQSPPAVRKDGPLAKPLELIDWSGSAPGQSGQAVDMSNGFFYTWERKELVHNDICANPDGTTYPCPWTERWIETTRGSQYIPSGQTVFVHDPQVTDVSGLGNWNPSGETDLSPTSVNCALKRMVTLTSSSGGSVGRFEYDPDNPSSALNIPSIGTTQYSVKYSGLNKIIYTAADKSDMDRLGW